MTQIKHEIVGLEALLNKLAAAGKMAALRLFFERAALAVVKASRMRSPYRTGRLQASLVHRIDTAEPPKWAEVATGVTARGFSYPTLLEVSDITHYRATARMGQPTHGWFSSSLADADADLKNSLEKLGQEAQSAWEGS